MAEFCHNRSGPTGEWCGKPAEFIVWGKLFPPDALGPRCYDCAAEQIGHNALAARSGYAIYRLPEAHADELAERLGRYEEALEQLADERPALDIGRLGALYHEKQREVARAALNSADPPTSEEGT